MNSPIGQKDYDFLARKLGFEDMKAVQAERLAQEQAKQQAEQEAQAQALIEEQERIHKAEEKEINQAIQERMTIRINATVYRDAKTHKAIVCPECGKKISWMRETLLLCKRRATFRGERRFPEWFRSASRMTYDIVPTGSVGSGLIVYAPSLLCQGESVCPECNKALDIAIECQCVHDGESVQVLKGAQV